MFRSKATSELASTPDAAVAGAAEFVDAATLEVNFREK